MPDVFVSEEKDKKEESIDKKDQSKPNLKEVRKTNFNKKQIPLFASIYYYPQNIKFIDQEPEENVILFIRSHMITNIGWILISILMILAPIVLIKFPILEFLPERYQVVAVLGWYLITTAYVFENFLNWFFNVNIITKERVVDVDFVNLLYREISDANINKIQDVTVKMGGVFRSIFNFGTIIIQTAGEVNYIEFIDVPEPDKVAAILTDLRLKKDHRKKEGK